MIATVRVYYNTGLTVNNCLDDISMLDTLNFASRDFSNIAIKQDRGLISIRLNTVYDNIKDGDYAKINNTGYWINGITMLNDNVAEVTLQQDYLTTVGVAGLISATVVSGWCKRKHVMEDPLFGNTLDEPFTPTNMLEIDFGSEITGSGTGSSVSILVTTIDIRDTKNLSIKYAVGNDPTKFCLVPKIPDVLGSETFYTIPELPGDKTIRAATIAGSAAFNWKNNKVNNGVANARNLGIDSLITAAYRVPGEWIQTTEGTEGIITDCVGKGKITSSSLNPVIGSYKNNKVYSGQFQKYVCYSLASGDYQEARVEDIVSDQNTVIWQTFADTRYSGKPMCVPRYFHKAFNKSLVNLVNGANWQQTPILYDTASGYQFIREAYLYNRGADWTNGLGSAISGMTGILGGVTNMSNIPAPKKGASAINTELNFGNNLAGLGGNIVTTFTSAGAAGLNKRAGYSNYLASVLQPEVKFPQAPQMQDYIGNRFYEFRYRLSDSDLTRFDNFLTQYGYAVNEPFVMSCLNGRKNFNYVQADDVVLIKNGFPQYLLQGVSDQLAAGVRVWHVAPDQRLLFDNPIV